MNTTLDPRQSLEIAWHSIAPSCGGLDEVYDDLRNLVVTHDCTAFLEACSKAPGIVRQESSPRRFYDAFREDAGKRLISYWKNRFDLFGSARAVRPLSLEGADEVEFAESGAVALLPFDDAGRRVFCTNLQRRPVGVKPEAVARTYFWVLQQAPFSVVWLAFASQKSRHDSRIREIINSMPLKVLAFHVAVEPSLRKGSRRWAKKIMVPEVLQTYGPKMQQGHSHVCGTVNELYESLQEFGLQQLPEDFGGTWNYASWQAEVSAKLSACSDSRKRSANTEAHHNYPPNKKLAIQLPVSTAATELKSPQLSSPPQGLPQVTNSGRSQLDQANASKALVQGQIGLARSLLPNNPMFQSLVPSAVSSRELTTGAVLEKMQMALGLVTSLAKTDLHLAQELAPQLVLEESNPAQFLSFANLDAVKAAQLWAQYWGQRREVWGDQAFFPIEPASTQDIAALRVEPCVLLPRDSQSRSVIGLDCGRVLEVSSIKDSVRQVFQVLQAVMGNPISQRDGCVVVCIIGHVPSQDVTMLRVFELLQGFPMAIQAYHLVNRLPTSDVFRRVVASTCGHLLKLPNVVVHFNDVENGLRAHGINTTSFLSLDGLNGCQANIAARLPVGSAVAQVPYWNPGSMVSMQSSNPHSTCTGSGVHEQMAACGGPSAVDPLYVAIQQLSKEDKVVYSEARQKVSPSIWDEECRGDKFVATENGNTWMAAKRMSRYWKLRADTFGRKKFFCLSQTGEGALGRKDLAVLGSGFVTLLPHDAQDRSALWIDARRLPPTSHSADCVTRCLFYMYSLMAENKTSQSKGVCIFYRIDSPNCDVIDSTFLQRLAESLPLRVESVHFVSLKKDIKDNSTMKFPAFEAKTYTHVEETRKALFARIAPYGFDRISLPKYLGGEWGYSKFVQWQELRTRVEWHVPLGLSGRENAEANFPAIKAFSLLSCDQKAERTRRLNVIHTRRKRDKMRVDADLLEEQCVELRDEQAELKHENERLVELVKTAQEHVARS